MTTRCYYRHSTDSQDDQSQHHQVQTWLNANTPRHYEEYHDTASGSKDWRQRVLFRALAESSPGDTIVVSEISRIARSTIGVLTFLKAATEAQVNVVAVRNGLTIDESLHSRITVTILALCAEIERELIRERTKAALAARRANGQKLGRPSGPSTSSKLDGREAEIQALLKAQVPRRAIARVCKVAPSCLYRFLKLKGIDYLTIPIRGL